MFLKKRHIVKSVKKILFFYFRIRSKFWVFLLAKQALFYNGRMEHDNTLKVNCPVRCDGVGTVSIGGSVTLGYSKAPRYGNGEILLQARRKTARIEIGSHTATSNNVTLIANDLIEIGENCLIGDLVSIVDSDFHAIDLNMRKKSNGETKPVFIGDNVWLGSRVMVFKGVSIGENSVIAAGSIVSKSIPGNVVAGGIPAKVIRSINQS